MVFKETETQTRLRRAKEALYYARDKEAIARNALAIAVDDSRRAKEKYEALFLEEEMNEVARRKSRYNRETE